MNQDWCTATSAGIRLAVQAVPNAKKSEVAGVAAGLLKVRLQAPAIEGRANDALIRFLAEKLRIPKSSIRLVGGQTARRKLLEIHADGLSVQTVRVALAAAVDEAPTGGG